MILSRLLPLVAAFALAAPAACQAAPTISFVEPSGSTVVTDPSTVVTIDASDPSGIDRCQLDVDDVKVSTLRPPAAFTWTVDTSAWADGSSHLLRATCYAGDLLSNKVLRKDVTAVADPAPVAVFSATQGAATLTTLDASASTGTGMAYSWELDGAAAGTGETLDVQPSVGVHHVKLTVTDDQDRTAVDERDVAVAWRGTPYTAQVDNTNGFAGGGEFLPQLTQALAPAGPWRTVSCLNNGYAYRPQADGTLALEVHQGDHPGLTGGDRCGLGINEAFTPYSDVNGNQDGLPRFYRVDFMLDPSLAGVDLHDVFNNFMEWHGKASGGSVLKIGVDSDGDNFRVYYTKMLQGVAQPSVKIDEHPIVAGEWQNYVVEARWSADPAVGYVRVYRDGVCKTCGMAGADAEGRIFGETLKQLQDGSFEAMAFGIQNYRQKDDRPVTGAPAGTTEPLPDTTIHYRDTAIGPTYASVAG